MINFPSELDVECNGCGKCESFKVSEYAGDPPTIGIDAAVCPDCKEEE